MHSPSTEQCREIADVIADITGDAYRKQSWFETDITGQPCLVSFETVTYVRCIQEPAYDRPALFETRCRADLCLLRPLYRPGETDLTDAVNKWL